MSIDFKIKQGTEHKIYRDALKIREEVFIDEQGVKPDREKDGQDNKRYHIVGYDHDKPVVTARFYLENEKCIALKLERFAVRKSFRGRGIGSALMNYLIDWARHRHVDTILLSAQESAIPFYQSLNFKFVNSNRYLDAGIVHRDMKLNLKS